MIGFLDFIPGLRERIEIGQRFSGLPIAPARSFPQGATGMLSGEDWRLEEMTSAAYGVGRDSVACALAEGCPPLHCPQHCSYRIVFLRTIQRTARPDLRVQAPSGWGVGVGCSVASAARVRDAANGRRRGPRTRSTDPVTGPGLRIRPLSPTRSRSLDSIPGLRERIEILQKFSGLPNAPARSFPQGATGMLSGEDRALRKRPRRPSA